MQPLRQKQAELAAQKEAARKAEEARKQAELAELERKKSEALESSRRVVQVALAPVQGDKEAIKAMIVKWANYYGVSAEWLLRIASCESGYNPNARNRGYTAIVHGVSYGNPVGLFQHVEGYWPARATAYGVPGASIYDPEAQARVTAGMFRDGQSSAWECK